MSSQVETKMPSMGITKLKTKEETYPNKNDSTRAANKYIDSFIKNTQSSRRSFKERKVSEAICNTLEGLPGAFSIRMYCISRTVVPKWREIVEILTSGGATDHVDKDEDGSAAAAAAAADDGDGEDEDDDDDGGDCDGEDTLIFLTTNTPDNLQFHPEIYALTSGHVHRILKENMCDGEFPMKCAKRVLKFNLKALSSKQLTGPLSSKTESYKPGESTMVTFLDYLGQITTSYKMPLRDDASLYELCLRTKTGTRRKASMTVGETYLRMSPEMSLKDIALLLYQLSRIARGEETKKYQSEEQELDDKAFDVLYHVKILKDTKQRESFNDILMEIIISHLKGESGILGLYLSYRDLKTWETANEFELKNRRQTLQTWNGDPPYLVDLLQEVVKYKDKQKEANYRDIINKLSLQMSGSHEGIDHTNPLLKYIYGQITESGESLFCYDGKWLKIENEYMVDLEDQFSKVKQQNRLCENILPLPWKKMPTKRTFEGGLFLRWMKQILHKDSKLDDFNMKAGQNTFEDVKMDDYMEKPDIKFEKRAMQLFRRMLCKQDEKHYNEGYILYDQLVSDNTSGYLLGDRIFVFGNNIELYDILFYTPEKTYLIHVKEGFDNAIRDVCSQIRNSAEVVFKHWIFNNSFDILKKYWSSVTGYEGKDRYRQVVRDRYMDMGQERFLNLFDRKEIVYVLAYRDTKKTPSTMVRFDKYPEQLQDSTKRVVDKLLRCQFLKRDAAGRICVTDKAFFYTEHQAKKEIEDLETETAKKEIEVLMKAMRNHSSFIAKTEVVHLYGNFKHFVTPKRRLSLKLCSIKTEFE
ncbi:uncharacterized protein [Haliotis cracherodii]|uniref:uncharacterized protein n=1 Tax=Haliotis cracherodii TaxID=6455 RepID=UPI0039E87567